MSEWKTVGTKVTVEEYEQLNYCIEEFNKENNTTLTMNSFVREMILNYLEDNKDYLQRFSFKVKKSVQALKRTLHLL